MGHINGQFIPHAIAKSDIQIVYPQHHAADGQPDAIIVFAQAVQRDGHHQEHNDSRPSFGYKGHQNVLLES